MAAYACSLEALKALLERGALMMVRDDRGLTAVHYGCQSGCVEVVELLLRRGGKKAIRATVEGRYLHETTPMHIAAASGHIQMMELLHREAEWLKTARDEDGCTPLHIAVSLQYSSLTLERASRFTPSAIQSAYPFLQSFLVV